MNKIAHIWKTSRGWMLEISTGAMPGEFLVVSTAYYPSKIEAKRAAHAAGAQPWNYS